MYLLYVCYIYYIYIIYTIYIILLYIYYIYIYITKIRCLHKNNNVIYIYMYKGITDLCSSKLNMMQK